MVGRISGGRARKRRGRRFSHRWPARRHGETRRSGGSSRRSSLRPRSAGIQAAAWSRSCRCDPRVFGFSRRSLDDLTDETAEIPWADSSASRSWSPARKTVALPIALGRSGNQGGRAPAAGKERNSRWPLPTRNRPSPGPRLFRTQGVHVFSRCLLNQWAVVAGGGEAAASANRGVPVGRSTCRREGTFKGRRRRRRPSPWV